MGRGVQGKRKYREKRRGNYVCLCLCVNMEVSFALVRKIYFEGSRKYKDHESIACTVQRYVQI